MSILAVTNQKSVGKTTIVFHLTHRAADADKSVLIVSLDAQGSLELVFPKEEESPPTLMAYELFEEEFPTTPLEYITDKVAFVRARDPKMFDLDTKGEEYVKRFRKNLRKLAKGFDICIVDTPGRICMPLTASMAAADVVLCPTSMGLFELDALAQLWKFIQTIKQKGTNPQLRLMGILPSLINTKSKDELKGLDDVRRNFGPAVMSLQLSRNAAVHKSISNHRPVWQNTNGEGHRKAAAEWKNVCDVILANVGVIK
jgi:chromosome partitioning protein